MTKYCSKCDTHKPLEEFANANKGLFKKQCYCKVCQKLLTEKWRKENQSKVNEWARKKSKSIEYRYKTAIRAAKKRGYDFLISFDDFRKLQEMPCTYCNNKLSTPSGSGLDRLDNNEHYTLENVVTSCIVCNKIRNVYMTHSETKEIIAFLLKLRGFG